VLRNCNGAKESSFKHVTSNGMSFDRCPKSWLRDEAQDQIGILNDWHWLKSHNIPPYSGGRYEQNPLFVESCDIIDGEVSVLQKREEDLQLKKIQGMNRGK
jgi:hypothetical protein